MPQAVGELTNWVYVTRGDRMKHIILQALYCVGLYWSMTNYITSNYRRWIESFPSRLQIKSAHIAARKQTTVIDFKQNQISTKPKTI